MQPIGLLTLTGNPTNFFAETEQVAFHLGNLVPGIDVTNDPLLQARLFSYLDTQLTRLGGPNFDQIPINRPHAPVNDMLRDGFHQHAVHAGVAPYRPNSLDGGCPFVAGRRDGAFVDVPVRVAESAKVRAAPASFDDHFSQARLFWLSMTPVEQEHIVRAYTFELGKCYEQAIKERQLLALANIDPELCAQVADRPRACRRPSRPSRSPTSTPSPALSQLGGSWPTDGRMVGIVVDPDGDLDGRRARCGRQVLAAEHGAAADRRRTAARSRTASTVQRTFADRPVRGVRRRAARRGARAGAGRAARPGRQGGRGGRRRRSTRGSAARRGVPSATPR